MKIDLHMHSDYSDGLLPVNKMISILVQHGIKIFSVTDHDTVEAIDQAYSEARKTGIELIPGIEISAEYQNQEVHILGYYIDHTHPELLKQLIYFKQKRLSRIDHIIEKLNQNGIFIDRKHLEQAAKNGVLGRPHIADLLIKKGIVATRKEAFKKYLGTGSPAFVPREKVLAEKAISLILESGGVPVIAHPGTNLKTDDLLHLLSAGAMGIEVYHPDHNLNLTDYYHNFAVKQNILITGGTDWHGDKLYSSYHPITIPYEQVNKMKHLKSS